MSSATTVRNATTADVPAITLIYNQGIVDRIATLETLERTEDERLAWLTGRGERHPVLVADQDGRVHGWASINNFNPRDAYRHVADFSIYIERSARGRGIGSTLMQSVVHTARALDYHKLVLAAFPSNDAGMRLYRRFGFREVGVYREHGNIDGRWVDVVIMELLLGAATP